jgi:hypothetical protein
MMMKGKIMKKILMIAALVMTATTANADQWKLPANSVWNDSNVALQFPEELNYFLKGGINLNNVIGAVIATTIDPRGYHGKAYPNGNVIDPRGYHGSAYPNGKRPKLNYKLGNMGTGKCYPDPKGNGIYCP